VAKKTTPSFVLELLVVVSGAQDRELQARFQAGLQLYNAVLGEAEKRRKQYCASAEFKAAKVMPKGKARSDAFLNAASLYEWTNFDLQAFAGKTARDSNWIAQKVDANTVQVLATRAFKATERIMFGNARKVRFKGAGWFKSMQGKTNKQGIRIVGNQLVWGRDLKLDLMIDGENPVHLHGLRHPVKFVRILRRDLNGKRRWFAQVVLEGLPYTKPENFASSGLIGLDLNISNVAFVGDNWAGLLPFADGVPTMQAEISDLQRRMQRSQRANNPDCYEPDFLARKGRKTVTKKGKFKKGKRVSVRSNAYKAAAKKKREIERRKAAHAKSQNNRLVNEVLRHGKDIKTEKVSVKGWQKRYGKAISAKSPATFQSELKRKAESAGGSFTEFSTRRTALSQAHLTGERVKKKLSERIHRDKTGIVMQRDLFSAYLSRFVTDDMLSIADAASQYPGSEMILRNAWQAHQSLSAKPCAEPGGVRFPRRKDVAKGKERQPDNGLVPG
jgi:putative transposase